MSTSNGKRMQTNMRMKDSQTLPPVPQHEELIKFIFDSWNKVCQEYQKGTPTVAYHTETDPNPMLKDHKIYGNSMRTIVKALLSIFKEYFLLAWKEDFVPFDLEAWWGKRVVQNITQNS